MNKKIFLLIVAIFFFVGCKQEKYYLDKEHYEKNDIIEIDNKKLKKFEEERKNFAIFIFLPGCSSCAEFKLVLDEFTKDNNLMFYSISISDVEGTEAEKVEYAPSFILYKDGKVVDLLDSASDEELGYFKSSDMFKEWLEKYIYLTK